MASRSELRCFRCLRTGRRLGFEIGVHHIDWGRAGSGTEPDEDLALFCSPCAKAVAAHYRRRRAVVDLRTATHESIVYYQAQIRE